MNHNHGSSSSSSSAVKAALLDNEENSKQKEPAVTVSDSDTPVVAKEMKPHVLIVDHDPVSRFNLQLSFVYHGCIATTVETCEEALSFLRIDQNGASDDVVKQETIPPVDLIIVDYFMDGAKGLEGYMMLPILKKSPMAAEIPVVVLAPQPGPLTEAQSNRCMEDGADFFVTKPLSRVEVEKFKSIMMKKIGVKKYSGMNSDPLKRNLSVAKATGDDPDTGSLNASLIMAKATGDDPDTDPLNGNDFVAKAIGEDTDTDSLNANFIMAKAIADDPQAFNFPFDESIQPMQEEHYTYFEDYLYPFLV